MTSKHKANYASPPPTSPKWGGNDSLGSKIETMFIRFFQKIIHWGYEFMGDLLVDIFDASMKIMRPGLSRVTDPMIEKILALPDVPAWYKSVLQKAMTEQGESAWFIKLAVFWAGVSGTMFGGLAPIRRLAEYNADTEARSFLPDVTTVSLFNRIGLMTDTGFDRSMNSLGLADPLKAMYKELTHTLPSLGELFHGYWRGVISADEFSQQLKRMGYDPKDIELFKELSKNIPPVQDLIRFLVRDAFNPGAIAKYGYAEEYPEEINKFFAQQGYDPDWAKRYWYAHWNLPSPTQAYEMLHRNLIDQATLDELLKISDYPPFWREKLRAISYSVITRVDLRRLYQAGLIPESRLLKGYKDLGYPDEDAQALAEFAKRGASEKEKDLTRADVLGLYEDNLIDRGEAEQAIIKLGYDSQEAEFLLERADYNISKSMRTDHIRYVQEKYYARTIDKTGVNTELLAAGLSQRQIDRYLLQWDRTLDSQVTPISKTDGLKFYLGGYIGEPEYRAILKALGYAAKSIELYIKQANDLLSNKDEGSA